MNWLCILSLYYTGFYYTSSCFKFARSKKFLQQKWVVKTENYSLYNFDWNFMTCICIRKFGHLWFDYCLILMTCNLLRIKCHISYTLVRLNMVNMFLNLLMKMTRNIHSSHKLWLIPINIYLHSVSKLTTRFCQFSCKYSNNWV